MNLRHLQHLSVRRLAKATLTLAVGVAPVATAAAQPYAVGQPSYRPSPPAAAPYASPLYGAPGQRAMVPHGGPQYASPQYAPQYAAPQYAAPSGPQTAMRPYHRQPYYCPPGYQPGQPQLLPQGVPEQMPSPSTTAPTTPSTEDSQSRQQTPAQTPGEASSGQQQTQDQSQQQQQQQPFGDLSNLAQDSASTRASLSPGANTPQLGRTDQSNRLNLFDNMTAAPQTRVWFGLQYADSFDTALRPTEGLKSFVHTFPGTDIDTLLLLNEGITSDFFQANQTMYRVGGEYALTEGFSVAVQGQYVGTLSDDTDPNDEWTQPQILLKDVVFRDCDTIFTATLGVTPETSADKGDIEERTTKLYPGMLFYEQLSRDWFLQGGALVGIPLDNTVVTTSDWSLALGWWLYRDPDPCGHGRCHRPFFLRQLRITGIVPQLNVLGKHVVGENIIHGPFGFAPSATGVLTGFTTSSFLLCDPVTGLPVPGPGVTISTPTIVPFDLPEGFVIYQEPHSVVDMTLGTTILIGDGVQVGVGYSFPLTRESVRDDELITTLTYVF